MTADEPDSHVKNPSDVKKIDVATLEGEPSSSYEYSEDENDKRGEKTPRAVTSASVDAKQTKGCTATVSVSDSEGALSSRARSEIPPSVETVTKKARVRTGTFCIIHRRLLW